MTADGGDGRIVARPKMTDIARLAGVSVATVSRALAGSRLVNNETRARIETAVAATGYVVNHVAAGLRLQRSRQILVLLPTIANPFFAEIVLGIEEIAQPAGFAVLVGSTGGDAARQTMLARQMQTGAVDGIILLTGTTVTLPEMGPRPGGRIVAVSERIPGAGLATVAIDHVAAAQTATAHLLDLGHRRLAHITGPAGNILTRERLAGFRDALRAAGIDPASAPVAAGDFTFAAGAVAMRRLLGGVGTRPTGVFCANDETAIGAINAARAAGLRVPADLSVVGFDDIAFAAAYDPPLTTIRQPRRALGRTAAAVLLSVLTGAAADDGREIVLAHELVVRGSTRSITAGQTTIGPGVTDTHREQGDA